MIATRGQVVDAAAALAVLLVCGYAAQESGHPTWWQWVMVVAVAGPVAVRRHVPLPAAVVTMAASAGVLICGVISVEASPGLCAAVALTQYEAAVSLPPSRSIPALATGLSGAAGLGLWWPATLVVVPAVAISWTAGRLVRHRRNLAEQVFEARTAGAVTEERLRLARDMHDIVAHSLSMIAMKASVARHVAAVRPEESMAALEVIETASREALIEMRRAIGLLRADQGPATPADGDQDLRTLARRAEQAGVQVETTFGGETTPPAAVHLVVYRIVQEALTNVVRHAQATRCTVDVETDRESVTVRVVDNGTATVTSEGGGHGLRGMRERVTAYGGSLQAGPCADGGFAVTARVPYHPAGRGGRP
ncbi:two-component sensor histidine kinase [Actinoplanes sp. OR16]|uniref:sensor histidine kinase n=1 Tax=Actinoplanes sp. OR16 TaxID=946334 RepID=UPI000F6C1614|nr:sensor histidine kinase [Actinoplanes sp. OR16]BBH69852.1 two-component sensor histidine kinase [Actinoplanes sp. OR16]